MIDLHLPIDPLFESLNQWVEQMAARVAIPGSEVDTVLSPKSYGKRARLDLNWNENPEFVC